MNDPAILDKTFHFILKRMIETGRAPHYTEIAAELGTSREVVTRILADFEIDKIISTSRGRIAILKPAELKERAGTPANA